MAASASRSPQHPVRRTVRPPGSSHAAGGGGRSGPRSPGFSLPPPVPGSPGGQLSASRLQRELALSHLGEKGDALWGGGVEASRLERRRPRRTSSLPGGCRRFVLGLRSRRLPPLHQACPRPCAAPGSPVRSRSPACQTAGSSDRTPLAPGARTVTCSYTLATSQHPHASSQAGAVRLLQTQAPSVPPKGIAQRAAVTRLPASPLNGASAHSQNPAREAPPYLF